MSVLNIRNFPTELLHRIKVQAVLNRITARQFVIEAVERALQECEKSPKQTRSKTPRK